MRFSFRQLVVAIASYAILLNSIACQNEKPVKQPVNENKNLVTISKAVTDSKPVKNYAGASLDTWKDRLKNFEPENESSKAFIPGLLEIVQDESLEWHVRKSAAFALARLQETSREQAVPILLQLSKPKANPEETQVWAGKAIARFGAVASSVTPEIRERLLREEGTLIVRLTFIDALSRIGTSHPLAIPTLIEVLQKSEGTQLENTALREAALLGLMSIGPAAAPATLALIKALNDPQEGVRSKAAMTLEKIGPLAASASAPLAEMIILEESLEARNNAANALASMGPSALPLIEKFLSDEDVLVRRAISKAVSKSKTKLPKLQKSVLKNLNDKDNTVQINSIESLMNDPTYRSKETLINNIIRLLESKSRAIRVKSIELLVKLPIKNDVKLQKIDGLRDHPKREVRSAIKEAIKRLSKEE